MSDNNIESAMIRCTDCEEWFDQDVIIFDDLIGVLCEDCLSERDAATGYVPLPKPGGAS